MAITGGSFKDFRYGGLTYRPTDGEAEFQVSGIEFETFASPNEDDYADGKAVIGYVQQECAMTASEFIIHKNLQKTGAKRATTVTTMGGTTLSVNGRIDGEQVLTNGKCTVKIAGKVREQ